ncbi:MAG: S1/P1 nuclease [Sphingobium sp.]
MAWGPQGHIIVADIAQQDLTPAAKAQVVALLSLENTQKLADIANWADAVKGKVPGSPSHSVRFAPKGPLRQDACPNRFCALAGLDRYSAVLADRGATARQRLEALKYVVHLVGDIHVPLHAFVSTGDRVPVNFAGKDATLHKVWDTLIISTRGKDTARIGREVLASGRVRTVGKPLDWALESRDIARERIFRKLPLKSDKRIVLPVSYATENWPVVETRLNQAGHRLGALLNSLLR